MIVCVFAHVQRRFVLNGRRARGLQAREGFVRAKYEESAFAAAPPSWLRGRAKGSGRPRRHTSEAAAAVAAPPPAQVRKTPSWPRIWANSCRLSLHSHRNARASLHPLG